MARIDHLIHPRNLLTLGKGFKLCDNVAEAGILSMLMTVVWVCPRASRPRHDLLCVKSDTRDSSAKSPVAIFIQNTSKTIEFFSTDVWEEG